VDMGLDNFTNRTIPACRLDGIKQGDKHLTSVQKEPGILYITCTKLKTKHF